ncbi:hypothetical protein NDU88_004629 [Pleurodeles waltl]|uniref:Uncharacterized protein n=1 Tax=Pleurodeles waltl TaxID=8319 RepID=A0AAV7QIV2_PLEWA|nr:hypothetical protein NDU88_004629 [Pleurodeles waltl]
MCSPDGRHQSERCTNVDTPFNERWTESITSFFVWPLEAEEASDVILTLESSWNHGLGSDSLMSRGCGAPPDCPGGTHLVYFLFIVLVQFYRSPLPRITPALAIYGHMPSVSTAFDLDRNC